MALQQPWKQLHIDHHVHGIVESLVGLPLGDIPDKIIKGIHDRDLIMKILA